MRHLSAGIVGLACFMAGVWAAGPLTWREIVQAQGLCDYAPCTNSGTAANLAAFVLLALLGIALLVPAVLALVAKPLFAVKLARILALAGTLVAVLSVTYNLIEGYDHPIEVVVPAVAFALAVSAIGFARNLRSSWAGAVMIVTGLLGFAATYRWWGLNTNYYLAVPLWLVAAGLLAAKDLQPVRLFGRPPIGSEPGRE